jgi:hypothetical protein
MNPELPAKPVEHRVYFPKPGLLPHSTKTVDEGFGPGLLEPDLPLQDLLSPAPTHTVGYAQVQIAIDSVLFVDPDLNRQTWSRKSNLRFDAKLYKQDHPDCGEWQAVVPRWRSMVGTRILVQPPSRLEDTGAKVLRSGESGYFYPCAYVQKQDRSAFVCPSLSGRR